METTYNPALRIFLALKVLTLIVRDVAIQRQKKQTKLIIEPKTLIVQLKCFEFDHIQQTIKKKIASVVCPIVLTLPGGSTYCLSSVLNHHGSSPNKGHYTVTLYDKENNSFILLDDSVIDNNVNISKEMWRLSYIVCYAKD